LLYAIHHHRNLPVELKRYTEIARMDELGRMDSPVHRLDARAQLLTTLLFILVVMSYSRYEVAALIPLLLYPVILVVMSNLSGKSILRKMAVAAPFALFVGIFNPWLDHHIEGMIGAYPLTGGWLSFASIMLRFSLTVSAAIILFACTGVHRLCAAGARMGMPQVFGVQVLFLYRYFFVIGDEGGRMARGVEMRSADSRSLGLRLYGILVGQLLLRAMDRAQRIYRAMAARGFEGEICVLQQARWGWRETGFVLGWLAFFLSARAWNIPVLLGHWITGGAG
jgi:cobalt/nickel transport system permease protein